MRRVAVAALLVLAACPKHPKSETQPAEPAHRDADDHAGDRAASDATATVHELVLPPAPRLPEVPAGLPALPSSPALAAITPDAVALGELLFYDARLSHGGKLACATCHDPAHGYAGRVTDTDAGKHPVLHPPTLVNLAWHSQFGVDGRFASLDAMLTEHVHDQLGDELATAVARVADLPLYRAELARVGGAPKDAALHALAAFASTRYSGDSAWDRLEPTATKTAAAGNPAIAGYLLFMGKAQCAICHVPPLYTDLGLHRGMSAFGDRGKVETPTLRGAAARRSLFHSGLASNLWEVLAVYFDNNQRGTADDPSPVPASVHLSQTEREQLIAFLEALTPDAPPPGKPALP